MDNLFQFFFTSPEIEEWVSDAQLRDKYDITFAENGWYQLNDDQDFALVIERHGKYKIWVWIKIDPRDEMEKILDLPLNT